MNIKIFRYVAVAAVAMLVVVIIAYACKFGTSFSDKQEHWGQFGDYVGGLLNPTFSLLAFLGLLWSIKMQTEAADLDRKKIKDEAEIAKNEAMQIYKDRLSQDLLNVIRDIDLRIEKLLEGSVSSINSNPTVTIHQMTAEAERHSKANLKHSGSYAQFLNFSKTPGTVIEAKTRELLYLISSMRTFLQHYSSGLEGQHTLTTSYYAKKIVRLLPMMKDIGGLPHDTQSFFENIAEIKV